MEPIIMKSNFNWTLVRCTGIASKPAKGKVNDLLTGNGLKFSIILPDMATFKVAQLEEKNTSNKQHL